MPITASQRPWSWVQEFPKHDLYPIVITRNIDHNKDQGVIVEKNNTYEVHRVNTVDLWQLQEKGKDLWSRIKRKIKKKTHPILHGVYGIGPVFRIYKTAKEIVSRFNSNETIIIATGKPFFMFKVASRIQKDTGIKWIADYRDDWSTTEIPFHFWWDKFLNDTIAKYQEKKWVSSASFFTTISNHYVSKIYNLLDKKIDGYVIQNGFFLKEHVKIQRPAITDKIKIIYVGSLYHSQDINRFIRILKKACLKVKHKGIEFHFLGTKLDKRRRNVFEKNLPNNLKFLYHSRLPKKKALELQNNCHFAALVPHTGLKGIPSSKIYEFIGSRIPIIYYPNDHDIIQDICTKCNLGITANNDNEFEGILIDLLLEKLSHNFSPNEDELLNYSRKNSSYKLATKIKQFMW